MPACLPDGHEARSGMRRGTQHHATPSGPSLRPRDRPRRGGSPPESTAADRLAARLQTLPLAYSLKSRPPDCGHRRRGERTRRANCPLGTAREPRHERGEIEVIDWTSALVHCPKLGLFSRRKGYPRAVRESIRKAVRGRFFRRTSDSGGSTPPGSDCEPIGTHFVVGS